MSAHGTRGVVVTAVGNACRRDDGVGPAVLDHLPLQFAGAEVIGSLASPLELLGRWDGAELAIVIDAFNAGVRPGEVCTVELDTGESSKADTRPASRASSHGFGLMEVFRVGRALGSAPARVVLVGVGGEDFSEGFGLSAATSRGVERAARVVVDLAEHGPEHPPSGRSQRGPVPGARF